MTHGSFDQLQKSVQSWIQTHCSLASLRPRMISSTYNINVYLCIDFGGKVIIVAFSSLQNGVLCDLNCGESVASNS